MRRIGYVLFALAGLSVVIALVSLGYGIGGPSAFRARAIGYGMLNFGFAVVNGMLGMVMLLVSRTPERP
jgi:hypothetical protein